jgi:hypothetical protein
MTQDQRVQEQQPQDQRVQEQWAELRQVGFAALDHEAAVRIAVETEAMGHRIVQLHPLDVGVLLELDEFLPREAWFWDELPGAKAAHAARTSKAGDIVAVDVAVDAAADPGRPAAMAQTWAAIIGIAPPCPPAATADGAALAFGRRTIRFVPARHASPGSPGSPG